MHQSGHPKIQLFSLSVNMFFWIEVPKKYYYSNWKTKLLVRKRTGGRCGQRGLRRTGDVRSGERLFGLEQLSHPQLFSLSKNAFSGSKNPRNNIILFSNSLVRERTGGRCGQRVLRRTGDVSSGERLFGSVFVIADASIRSP